LSCLRNPKPTPPPKNSTFTNKVKMRFSINLVAAVFAATCSLIAASPAPAPTSGDIIAPPPYIPCYTATVTSTRPINCPLMPVCVEPDCIILETTTIPCQPPHCSVTPTVTVAPTCPTGCHVGCGTTYRTVTADDCPLAN